MNIKKTALIVLFFAFLFFKQFMEISPDSALLYKNLTDIEISTRIDSTALAFYKNSSICVDSLFNRIISKHTPGAAVAIIQNGIIIHKNGYGLANLKTRQPIQPETRFMLASISKQFTAMAIMILAEEGKLSYDDPLPKYFPNIPQGWKTITIKHLLTHKSGLPDRFFLIGYAEGSTNQDILDRLIKHRLLDFIPGEKHKYSNSGYNLLAMIVEKVSGQPFSKFLKERIFEPLEMHDTVVYDETEPIIENRATAYKPVKRGYRSNDFLLFTTGASGIFSSIEDLFRWDKCLYTEKLVSFETLNEAFSPHAQVSEWEYYGYGWRITGNEETKVVYHTGTLGGTSNIIFRVPEKRFTVIILSNSSLVSRKDIVRTITEFYHPGLIDNLHF